jgi:hypothetical protein
MQHIAMMSVIQQIYCFCFVTVSTSLGCPVNEYMEVNKINQSINTGHGYNLYVMSTNFSKYEGYPESKFHLRILLLQRCGHDGALACRVV